MQRPNRKGEWLYSVSTTPALVRQPLSWRNTGSWKQQTGSEMRADVRKLLEKFIESLLISYEERFRLFAFYWWLWIACRCVVRVKRDIFVPNNAVEIRCFLSRLRYDHLDLNEILWFSNWTNNIMIFGWGHGPR